jgi:hypothetical protein
MRNGFWGCVPGAGTRAGASRRCPIARKATVIYGRRWCKAHTTFWGPLERTASTAKGRQLAERGGKNAKKRAVVAVARKLAVLLHRLWVSGEVYEPLRNNHKVVSAVASAEKTGAEVDYQAAAPTEMRTPHLHRAKKSLTRECGWKDGDRAALASATHRKKREENRLDSHRPSHGRS